MVFKILVTLIIIIPLIGLYEVQRAAYKDDIFSIGFYTALFKILLILLILSAFECHETKIFLNTLLNSMLGLKVAYWTHKDIDYFYLWIILFLSILTYIVIILFFEIALYLSSMHEYYYLRSFDEDKYRAPVQQSYDNPYGYNEYEIGDRKDFAFCKFALKWILLWDLFWTIVLLLIPVIILWGF